MAGEVEQSGSRRELVMHDLMYVVTCKRKLVGDPWRPFGAVGRRKGEDGGLQNESAAGSICKSCFARLRNRSTGN